MIAIKLFKEGKLIANADDIKLTYCSTSLLREFSFFNVKVKQRQNLFLQRSDTLQVKVYFIPKSRKSLYTDYFELLIHEINYADTKSWTVEGNVKGDPDNPDYIPFYSQGIVDVYNHWTQGKELEPCQLPTGISIMDYIKACYRYSSISEISPDKEVFEIDFTSIKSELEFVCCFAEEFLGKRSYMGRYFDTFNDCLLTLYLYRNKYFDDKYIKLKYKELILSNEMLIVIKEVERILNVYKFNIEVI